MTAKTWLCDAYARLNVSGASDALLDAKWMLCDALGVSLGRLPFCLSDEMTRAQEEILKAWLEKREAGLPLAYAQKRAYFMGHEFFIDERALVPRQDTELLCERALLKLRLSGGSALDLCTGSGAIAVSLAIGCPRAQITASDLSQDALCVARENARRYGVCVRFLAGDYLDAVGAERFDVIAVNPPYLTRADMGQLQAEVRFEPEMALYGGADGLDFYRRAARIRDWLKPGGSAFFEVGAGQAQAVSEILGGDTAIYDDLNRIARVVEARN